MLKKEDKDEIIKFLREQLSKIAGREWNNRYPGYTADELRDIAEKALVETTW